MLARKIAVRPSYGLWRGLSGWWDRRIWVKAALRFYFGGNCRSSKARSTSAILRPRVAQATLMRLCNSSGTSSVRRFIGPPGGWCWRPSRTFFFMRQRCAAVVNGWFL
jgi:hypothetical protein